MKYQQTKKQCQAKIKGVCEGCGGKLEPVLTRDNARQPTYWVACEHCSCFRNGIDKRYFDIARFLVEAENKGDIRLEMYLDTQTAELSRKIARIDCLLKNPPTK